jgi:hypothetical protein
MGTPRRSPQDWRETFSEPDHFVSQILSELSDHSKSAWTNPIVAVFEFAIEFIYARPVFFIAMVLQTIEHLSGKDSLDSSQAKPSQNNFSTLLSYAQAQFEF